MVGAVGRLFGALIYNSSTDMPQADERPVSELKNLGPSSAEWLADVDIVTVGDLRRLGPALAWRIVRERFPQANILLLWAMAAGLDDRHWQSLRTDEKTALRAEAERISLGPGARSAPPDMRIPILVLAACSLLGLTTARYTPAQVPAFSPLLEAQVYPAGGILVGGVRLGPFDVHAGWNLARRGNFGKHDNERGGGPGLGAGIWRSGGPGMAGGLLGVAGLHAGLRVDLWYLDIDWRDRATRGSTQITVLQPTIRLRFDLPGTPLAMTAAAGAEINMTTDGEDVGEGAIGLVGLRWAF